MKTFGQLRDEVLRWLDEYGDTDTTKSIVENAINACHARRCTEIKYPFMRSGVYTFTLDGRQDYALHEKAGKIDYLFNMDAKEFLVEVADRNLPGSYMSFEDSAIADTDYFTFDGYWPVKAQPTAAERIIVSSSTGEPAGPTITIEGEDASRNVVSETIAVPNTTVQSFARITRITKAGTVAGSWTLTGNTSSTVYLTLGPTEMGKQFPVIRFLTPVSNGDTIQYRFFRKPTVLATDNDIPDIPFPYCNVLVYDTLLLLVAYNEVTADGAEIWRREMQAWERNLFTAAFEGDTLGGQAEYITLVDH